MNRRELILGGGAALSLIANGCAGKRRRNGGIAERGES